LHGVFLFVKEMTDQLIKLENVSKVYKTSQSEVLALDDISLHVPRGEIFGVIGLSGAGKSTLIRCINLLERPSHGKVLVDGQEITSLSATQLRTARRQIGMIFQHFNLLTTRTVAQNISFPLEIAGVPKKERDAKVKELLALVGLTDRATAYPSQLSGGQKQRVGIARSLANNPKVLLCDEATSALDPQTTTSILELLKEINRKLNLTIVLITHEMKVIKEICDQVAVIHQSKIVELGPVVDLFTSPKTETAREFIKSVLPGELPREIINWQKEHPGTGSRLIKITFLGSVATEPVISSLVQTYRVKANILYGSVDHIKDTLFGTLTLQLTGPEESLTEALKYLNTQGLQLEVLSNVQ
jgi:D-methionine transport system ATP-binding protein